jgi:hypothetical protein
MAEDPADVADAGVPVGIFALSPAHAVADIYDFSSSKNSKLYINATAPLRNKHDGTVDTLCPMIDDLLLRSSEFGWSVLLTIKDDDNVNRDLIEQSRMITLTNIRTAAEAYINAESRDAQDNQMMTMCIMDSLTPEGSKSLYEAQSDYKVNNVPCGPLIIKVLLLECEVETAATNFYVRHQMRLLPKKIVELNYDVAAFNKHVNDLRRQLYHGGETSSALLLHVLLSYLACKDPDFVAGIKDQKRQFEAGKETLDLSSLVILALKQYQTLIQDSTYNKPTAQKEHIIALTAKLDKQMNDRSKSNKVDSKITKKKVKSFAAQPAKKTFDKPRVHRNEPAWMSIPPIDGRYVKKIEGVDWKFCRTHKKWGKHSEADCIKHRQEGNTGTRTTGTQQSVSTPGTLTMEQAIVSVLNQSDD